MAAIWLLQYEQGFVAVAGEVDQIPALSLLQSLLQALPSGAVLENSHIDSKAARLSKISYQLHELVALPPQREGGGIGWEAEDRQHAQTILYRNCFDFRLLTHDFIDQARIAESQRLATCNRHLPGPVEQA